MSQFAAIQKALSKGKFATAQLSVASSAWKTEDTGQVIALGDDAFTVNGEYGWQVVVRDAKSDKSLYFMVGKDKDKNSLYDAEATEYKIVFCEYLGSDTNKKSCFKAEPIV